ncbi:hypothetical protein HZS_482 [Henneguya salminicola]|nr:hypothetical protein HZS_482 [Henneguya salminicola]
MIGTRRRPPMFAHSIWNCYTSVIEGIPPTNNCVEGWNNKLNRLVGCAHSNIWTLINKIQDEQGFNEFKMDQIESGVELPKPKRIFLISKIFINCYLLSCMNKS